MIGAAKNWGMRGNGVVPTVSVRSFQSEGPFWFALHDA